MRERLWLLSVLCVVLLIAVGCIPGFNLGAISLWVEVPSETRLGELVPLKLKVKNNSIWPVTLAHGYPPHNFIVIKSDGTEVWRWATGLLDVILTTPLSPGEELEFTAEWDQRELKWDDRSGHIRGDLVLAGTYWVQGILHGNTFEKVYDGGAEHLKTKPKRLIIKPFGSEP